MSVMLEFLPLVAMLVVGIGFWALGQWLRRKGRGDQLDRLGVHFVKFRHYTYRIIGPLFGGAAIGLGRGLSRVPVLGNKRTREHLNVIDTEQQKKQDN
jgi:hypothetical protein